MLGDIVGILEQIVASCAHRFLGSSYSTFTSFILRMRKHRLILAQDTAFTRGSGLGMPKVSSSGGGGAVVTLTPRRA